MDKENNSNNIDDVLKLLKNKFENTDDTSAANDVGEDENNPGSTISPEHLKERLREQFGSGGEESDEEDKGEYSIDEELISEFYEDAQKSEGTADAVAIEENDEPEVSFQEDGADNDADNDADGGVDDIIDTDDAEDAKDEPESAINDESGEEVVREDSGDEIVEIVIPWVDSIAESAETLEDENEADQEENDDFYDEDSSENTYICFADEEANDDEIFEQEDEDDGEKDDATEVIDASDADVAPNTEEDDDLPWYSDEELPKAAATPKDDEANANGEEAVIILPIDEGDDEEYADAFEAALDEEERELEEGSGIQIDINDVLVNEEPRNEELETLVEAENVIASEEDEKEDVDASDDTSEAEELPAYRLFSSEKKTEPSNIPEEENISFYQTIINARAERESLYGYFKSDPEKTVDETVGQNENISVNEENDTDEIELPKFNQNTYSPESEGVEDKDKDKDEGEDDGHPADNDYYGTGENDADPDEDKVFDEKHGMPVLEFEQDGEHEAEPREVEVPAVWRIVKPIIMCALTLAIFILEMLPLLGIVPNGIFDYTSYPVTYILIDAQLLIFMAALCYEKLIDGLLKIITPAANFYSVLSVTFIVTLLCSIVSCFCANDDMPRLYNFISAAYILALHILEMLDKKRRKEGEKLLSEESVYTLHRSQGKNSCAEKMYLGGVDPDTNILEPVQVEAEDFHPAFSREKVGKNRNFANNVLIGAVTPVAIFAIFMAVLSIVFELGLFTSLNAFAFAFVSTAPLGAIIAYYLPILISSARLSGRGCVIAGYESAAEISECDALVFGDCHLFKECDAKEAGIKLYCDTSKTRELFICLAAVYAKIGGPMENTFASVLGGAEHKVNMIRITRSGFEAVVDNRTNLIVGGSDYLGRYGIVTDRADTKETGILYAAMNSTLCAKISVLYRTQPLFEVLNDILEMYGVRSVVETYDPMISGKYVARCRNGGSHPVSVVHKNINDYNLPAKDKVALGKAGVFATASRLKLVELIGFCKRITQIRRLNTGILIGYYAACVISCILLVLSGAMERMNLLWALLYHLILIGVYTALTIKLLPLSFDGMQKKKIREENKKQERENRNRI